METQRLDGTEHDVEMRGADTITVYVPERTIQGEVVFEWIPDSGKYRMLKCPPWRSAPKRRAKIVINGCTITAKQGDEYDGNIIETETEGRWLKIEMSREKWESQTGSEQQQGGKPETQHVEGCEHGGKMQGAQMTRVYVVYVPEITETGDLVFQPTPADSDTVYTMLKSPPWRHGPNRRSKSVRDRNGCIIKAEQGEKYNGQIIDTGTGGRWLEIDLEMQSEMLASKTGSEKQQEESSAKRARVFGRVC